MHSREEGGVLADVRGALILTFAATSVEKEDISHVTVWSLTVAVDTAGTRPAPDHALDPETDPGEVGQGRVESVECHARTAVAVMVVEVTVIVGVTPESAVVGAAAYHTRQLLQPSLMYVLPLAFYSK